jgi:serine O-acetyltransferase
MNTLLNGLDVFLFKRNANGTMLRTYRLAAAIDRSRAPGRFLARFLRRRIHRRFGCFLAETAQIGPGCHFPHPVGIVIGEGVVIGRGCTIFQNVTIGARRLGEGSRGMYPVLEDDVTVFAGAVITGPVTIGRGATIGANAVVTTDVPPGSVAVGVPAKVRPRSEQGQGARAAE